MNCIPARSATPRSYLLGQSILVSARLRDAFGEYYDATWLRLLYAKQGDVDSTVVSASVDPEGDTTGHFQFTPDSSGLWLYRVETLPGAPVSAAFERTVTVTPRTVPEPL